MESDVESTMTTVRDLEVEAESSDTSEDKDVQVIIHICTICHSSVDSNDIQSHLLSHKGKKKKRRRNGQKSSELNVNIDNLRLNEGSRSVEDDNTLEEIHKDLVSRDNSSITVNYDKLKVNEIDKLKIVEEILECSKTEENIQEEIEISGKKSFAEEKELFSRNQLINEPVKRLKDISNDRELPEGISSLSKQNIFWCKICNTRIRGYMTVFSHSKSKKHLENQRKFCLLVEDDFLKNGIIHVSLDTYQCSLCNCEMIGLITVELHVNGSRHRGRMINKPEIILEDANNYQELPKGILSSEKDNFFWCRICKVEINGYCNVLGHSKGKRHVIQRDSCLSSVDNNFSEKGIIHVFNDLYECSLCKCRISGWICVKQHVNGSRHQEAVQLQKETNEESVSLHSNTRNSSISQYSSSSSLSTLSKRPETLGELLPMGITHSHDKTYTCSLCMIGEFTSIRTHVTSLIHKKLVDEVSERENSRDEMSSKSSFPEVKSNDHLEGTSVDQSVDSPLPSSASTEQSQLPNETVNNEVSKNEHIDSLPKGIIHIYGDCYTCIICNYSITEINLIETHVKSVLHQRNAQKLCKERSISVNGSSECSSHFSTSASIISSEISGESKKNLNANEKQNLSRDQTTVLFNGDPNQKTFPQEIVYLEGTSYFCKLCKSKLYNVQTVKAHLAGKRHRQALNLLQNPPCKEQVLPKGIVHVYDKLYCCIACQCRIGLSKSFEEHVEDPQHEENVLRLGERMPSGEILGRRETYGLSKGIIHLYGNKYACVLCKCEISGENCLSQHIAGFRHRSIDLFSTSESTGSTGDNERTEMRKNETVNRIITPELSSSVSQSSLNSQGSRGKSGKTFGGITEVPGTDVISCEICDNRIFKIKNGIMGHINGNTHRMHLKQKLANLPEGIISTKIDNLFWCRRCDEIIKGFDNVSLHLKDKKHGSNQSDSLMVGENGEDDFKIGKKEIDALLKGIIHVRGHLYHCSLCDCRISGMKSISEHVKGQRHKGALDEFPKEKTTSVCSNGTNSEQSDYYSFPATPVSSFESVSPERIINTREEIPEKEVCDSLEEIIHVNDDIFECFLCELKSGLKSLEDHVKVLHYQNKMPRATDNNVDSSYSKDFCSGVNLGSLSTGDDEPEEMKEQLFQIDENIGLPLNPNDLPEGFESIPNENSLLCTICYYVIRPEDVKQHISSSDHVENYPGVISRIADLEFRCDICNCNMTSYKKTRRHLKRENHRTMKALKTMNNSLGEVKQLLSIDFESKEKLFEKLFPKSSNEEPKETNEQSSQVNKIIETPWNSENLPEGIERVFTSSKKSLLICTICNCQLPPAIPVDEHIATIDHRTNGKKVIVRIDRENFKCEICECFLGRYSSTMKHLRDQNHRRNKELIMPDDSTLLEKLYDLPERIVRQENNNNFWCTLCSCNVSGTLAHATLHVSSAKHENKLKALLRKNEVSCRMNTTTQSEVNGECDDLRDEKLEEKDEESCQINKNIELSSKSCGTSEDLPEGIEIVATHSKNPLLICTICNIKVPPYISVDEHVASIYHRNNGENVIVRISKNRFKCELCECTLRRYTKVMKHLKDANHRIKKEAHDARLEKLQEEIVSSKNHQMKLQIDENSTKVSETSTELAKRNTTAQRLISTFNLDNQEDSMTSSAPVEPEDYRKILPQSIRNVSCEICNCMISGGNLNVNEHRKSREHMENLAKMESVLESPEKEDKVSAPPTPQEFFLSNIPPEKMLEYHYIGDIINCIECKVCDLKIRETFHTPANLEYLHHTMSQEHKDNEIMFIDSWKLSMSSYAAKASAPANQQGLNNGGQSVKKIGKTIPCLICGEKFEFQRDLHSHMTKHFWKRFLKIPLITLEEESTGEIPKENGEVSPRRVLDKNDNNEESGKIPETKPVESPEDEMDLEFDDIKKNESPKKVHSPRRYRKKPLDIELNNELNIYEIDEQRREDIQLGVLLCFTIDKDNIYCLVCRKTVQYSIQNSYEHLSSVDHLDYLQEMIEDHKKFRNHPDQLSDLALAHEYMQEISEHDVQCHACRTFIPNDPLKLNHHINDPSHTEKWSSLGSNAKEIFNRIQSRMEFDFYSTRTYWCVPCERRWTVEIEFRRHFNKKRHAKKIRKFQSEMIFDYCAVCASLWYGFLMTFSYHSKCKMHKAQAYHNYYLMTKLPQSAERLLDAPEDEIKKIIDKVDTRRIDNRRKEDQLIRELERISKEKYPSVKAYPFGSRVSGLGGKNSDLDVFLDCSTKKYRVYSGENSSYEQILGRLGKIQNCLEQDLHNWHIDRCITDCRIPIIKTTHRPTGIECDISFTNGLTVENTKMINAYCENYPDCRKLIIFVKNWMGHCELTGLNGVNSYGIAWLVIYFLQVVSILPSVDELIDRRKESRIIGGWETGVETDFQPQSNDQSFRELLTKFFKFYATFDYRNNVMCPLIGKSVKKIDFQRHRELPSAMKTYLNYLRETDRPEPFRIDCIMCLQDPFDLGHNICKAVKKLMVYRLKTFCSFSAQILDNNA